MPSVNPIGSCHLVFHRTKSHYTWCKVVITVHNIIVGSIWMDQVDRRLLPNRPPLPLSLIPFSIPPYLSSSFSPPSVPPPSLHPSISPSYPLFSLKHLLLMHVREYKTAGGLGCQSCQNMWSYYMAQDYTLDLGATRIHN